MAKTRRILLVTLLIAVFGVISWLALRPHEPIYQGRPLTFWLDRRAGESIEAVLQIGTNAIPTLVRLLNAEDSKFKLQLLQLAEKQHVINFHPNRTEFRRFEAKFGLICLGPEAKSAVPVLMKIYREHRPGPYDDPGSIAEILTAIGPAAADAVPLLVQDTTNTNLLISRYAIQTLGDIHARPDLSVPALAKSLRDPVAVVRRDAAHSLGAFGPAAQSAMPELVNALADPSLYVRDEAAAALKQINRDPAAVQSAADPFTFKDFQ